MVLFLNVWWYLSLLLSSYRQKHFLKFSLAVYLPSLGEWFLNLKKKNNRWIYWFFFHIKTRCGRVWPTAGAGVFCMDSGVSSQPSWRLTFLIGKLMISVASQRSWLYEFIVFIKFGNFGPVWWCMPLLLAPWSHRQTDLCEKEKIWGSAFSCFFVPSLRFPVRHTSGNY